MLTTKNALWFGVGIFVCAAAAAQDLGEATRVLVVPVENRVVPVALTLVGSIEPNTRSLVASEVQGIVEELKVREGDYVKKGEVLCRLRDTVRRWACEEAEAELQRLEQQLAELEAGTRREELERAKAEMEEAKVISERWARELERVEKLREQGSASLKEYNDTSADATAARQRFNQAKANYDLAVAGPRKEEIAQARFAVEARKALLGRLKYDLEQTAIRAPFDGYAIQKHTEVGQWVNAGGPVVEFIDLETVLVRIDVPESAIEAAQVGRQVSVLVEALGETFRGKIRHVIPQAEVRARTFPIEVELPNADHRLKSGLFVRARVPAGPTAESLVVPRDAVLRRQGTDLVVMVVPSPTGEGMLAMPVPVQVGVEVDDWVAVSATMLQAGVPVAVTGHDRIYGPQPVVPMPSGGPSAAAPANPASQPAGR